MVGTTELGYTGEMPVKPQYPEIKVEPMEDVDIAQFCKQIREQLGLNKAEMATILGVSYVSYDHYEHRRREPSAQAVAKLFILRDKLSLPSIKLKPKPIKAEQEQS